MRYLLKITKDRKQKSVTLPVTVKSPNHFNKNAPRGRWVRKADPAYVKKNKIFESYLASADLQCSIFKNNRLTLNNFVDKSS